MMSALTFFIQYSTQTLSWSRTQEKDMRDKNREGEEGPIMALLLVAVLWLSFLLPALLEHSRTLLPLSGIP